MTPEQRTKLEADFAADWDRYKHYHRADAEDWERILGMSFPQAAMKVLADNAALDVAVDQESDIAGTVVPIVRELLLKLGPTVVAMLL